MMSPDQLFSVANLVAIAGWLLLTLFPRRRWASRGAVAIPLLLAIGYAAIVVVAFGRTEGGFSSLNDVARLFANRWMLLAGWIHYLAFDLLVGGWELRDSQQRGIPHLAVVPCLFLTFMFGPVGWLLYMGMRAVMASRPTPA